MKMTCKKISVVLAIIYICHKDKVTWSAYLLLIFGEASLSLSFIQILPYLRCQLLTERSSIGSHHTLNEVMHRIIALEGYQPRRADHWSVRSWKRASLLLRTKLVTHIRTALQFIRWLWNFRLVLTAEQFWIITLWTYISVFTVQLHCFRSSHVVYIWEVI